LFNAGAEAAVEGVEVVALLLEVQVDLVAVAA
jgi:hypothetical protein